MISSKGRYALRVMIDLARQNSDGYVPLKEIAERQNISKKYLEIIAKELVNAKLLKGVSGKGGGYKLTRSPEEYTVGEVLRLTEGDLAPVACLSADATPCERVAECRTLSMWKGYYDLALDKGILLSGANPLLDGAQQIVAPGLYGADLVHAGFHQLRVHRLVKGVVGKGQLPLGLHEFFAKAKEFRVRQGLFGKERRSHHSSLLM